LEFGKHVHRSRRSPTNELKPNASSSSRYASRPASGTTSEPRNWSITRRSADAVERGLVGEIILRLERRGYLIVGMKMIHIDIALARRHYAEHEGKPFFQNLIDDITSGPIVALVPAGNDAVEACRQAIGAADPRKASPGSIRADLAQTIRRNLVHASDSIESAEREVEFWFSASELYPQKSLFDSQVAGD
jgi:nucleoside-diphosphate kinase